MPPTPSDAPVGRASGLPDRLPGPPQARPKPALEALLTDLGPRIQRGRTREAADAASGPRFLPTGIDAVDALLGGGFPHGRLSEICGRSGPSAGRTALALAVVAETLSRQALVAWIDLADTFDPESAVEAIRERGDSPSELDHLLWIRARSEVEALRCCERVMHTEGFELIVFDPFPPIHAKGSPYPGPRDVTWLRLARLASSSRTALIALTDRPRTGARAELVLEMQWLAAHFSAPPYTLKALETRAALRRHRSRPSGEVTLPLHAESGPIDVHER